MANMTFQGHDPVMMESVSAVTATPSVGLGYRRIVDGEEYVYCYNAGGASCNAGYGVKLITGASGYSVAGTSLTDVVNPCVGVVKHANIPAASYGWILTKGFMNVHTANSALTGDYVAIALAAAGGFGAADPTTTTVGTANIAGFALGVNTGSAGTFYAFIRTGF